MYIFFSLLVSVVGAFVYAFAGKPKLEEIGRLMFGFGLLAFLLQVGSFHIGFPR
jgi:Na+/phosphate symporter